MMLVLHWGKTMTNDTVKSDNPAFIDAVCKLVDAVIIAQCFPVIGRGNSVNEEHALNCAFAVLREISATAVARPIPRAPPVIATTSPARERGTFAMNDSS